MTRQYRQLYEFDQFRLDAEAGCLLRAGELMALPPKAFELLLLLVEGRGQIIKKDFLMEALWGDTFVEESNLTQNIYLLRKTLGKTAAGEPFIETHSKRGYRFVPPVQTVTLPIEEDEEDELLVARLTKEHIVITETEVAENEASALPTRAAALPPAAAVRQPRPHRLVFAGLALALLAGAGFGLWRWLARNDAPTAPAALQSEPLTGAAGEEDYPVFSPDGRQVAYVWDGGQKGAGDIYVKLIGAGNPLRLTDTPQAESHLSWSPDGRLIAFQRDGKSLYVIPALGGQERHVCDHALGRESAWLADNKRIVLSGIAAVTGKGGLHLVDVASGAIRPLTEPPPSYFDQRPQVSPSGETIAFTRSIFLTTEEELYLLPVAGGAPRALPFKKHYLAGISWSATGEEIIAATLRQWWRVPINGGEPQAAMQLAPMIFSPTVARSGNLLAYKEEISRPGISRLSRSEGVSKQMATGKLQLIISSSREDHSPEFSPDGRKIVFASARTGNEEIWLCEADGSKPVQLTSFRQAAGSPHWSPDGRWIVFDGKTREEQAQDIFLMRPDGSATRQITTHAARDMVPTWSHDEQWLYFCSNRTGKMQLWKMPLDGGEQQAVQLTQEEAFEGWESPDGQYVYFAPGMNKPGRWRVPASGGAAEPVPELADVGRWRSWLVTKEGLWYIGQTDAAPFPIRLYDFTTRQAQTIALVEKEPLRWNSGLAVSPDGKWLLYAQPEYKQSNIMLVENFR